MERYVFVVTLFKIYSELELNSIILRSETDENRVHYGGTTKDQRTFDRHTTLMEIVMKTLMNIWICRWGVMLVLKKNVNYKLTLYFMFALTYISITGTVPVIVRGQSQ